MDNNHNPVELFLAQWIEKYNIDPSDFNTEELRTKVASLLENHPVETITNITLSPKIIETYPPIRLLCVSIGENETATIKVRQYSERDS